MLTNKSLGDVIGSVISKISERYKAGMWVNQDPTNTSNPFACPDCFLETQQDPSFAQKVLLSSDKSIIVIGDLHSSIGSLVEIIDELKLKGILDDNLKLAPTHVLICTGDMVDRGPYSLEVLYIMFLLMDRNDGSVFITNGNHEDYRMYAKPNGQDTMELEMQSQLSMSVSQILNTVLRYLPCVLFVNFDGEWLQFCHGGIDAHYHPKAFIDNDKAMFELHGYDSPNGDMVNAGLRWTDFTNRSVRDMVDIFKILGPQIQASDVIDGGDILKNVSRGSGAGFIYTPESTDAYLNHNGLTGIVRGHQDCYCLGLIAHASTVVRIATTRIGTAGGGTRRKYRCRTPLHSIYDLTRDQKATDAMLDHYGIDSLTQEEPGFFFVHSIHMDQDFGANGSWCSTRYDNVFKNFSVVTTSTATNARKESLFFHTFSIISKQTSATKEERVEDNDSERFLVRSMRVAKDGPMEVFNVVLFG